MFENKSIKHRVTYLCKFWKWWRKATLCVSSSNRYQLFLHNIASEITVYNATQNHAAALFKIFQISWIFPPKPLTASPTIVWQTFDFLKEKKNQIFYTSTKSWRSYIFTAVCLCVCVCVSVSVCQALLVNKIPAEWIWTQFSLNGCFYVTTGSDPIKFGDLGSKVKVTET